MNSDLLFEQIPWDEIPPNRDFYLLKKSEFKNYLYLTQLYYDEPKVSHPNHYYLAVRAGIQSINSGTIDLMFILNSGMRAHFCNIKLPKKQLHGCYEWYEFMKQPLLVVSDKWFETITSNTYSCFSMIDMIGVKEKIEEQGEFDPKKLQIFHKQLKRVSNKWKSYNFISSSDQIIIQYKFSPYFSNYHTYQPENLILITQEIKGLIQDIIGLDSYAIITQGYLFDSRFKPPKSKNLFILNSLGKPFHNLFRIEQEVRRNHFRDELYVTKDFAISLSLSEKSKLSDDKLNIIEGSERLSFYRLSLTNLISDLEVIKPYSMPKLLSIRLRVLKMNIKRIIILGLFKLRTTKSIKRKIFERFI